MKDKSFTFIHCSDLHLGKNFSHRENIDKKIFEYILTSSYESFKNIVKDAIKFNVDFIVISGDVFDTVSHKLKAQLFLKEQFEKLNNHGINVYMIHGNHDPVNEWKKNIDFPKNTFSFSTEEVKSYEFKKSGEILAKISGISFGKAEIQENLSLKFENKKEEIYNIALLHSNVGGIKGLDNYSPASLNDLIYKNFDYWALGHYHNKKILNQNPYIVYSGTTQGLSINENGEKGYYLVKVYNKNTEIEFKKSSVLSWEKVHINLDTIESIDELLNIISQEINKLKEETPKIIRILLNGHTKIHNDLTDENLNDILSKFREAEIEEENFIWIEKIKNNTLPEIEIESLKKENDFISRFIENYDEMKEGFETILSKDNSYPRLKKYINNFTEEEKKEILQNSMIDGIDFLRGEKNDN
ncbi:MAG: metallophosphoesterase family protein [Thermotogota bacterium]